MRVIFMGSPDFSVPALKALKEVGHEIVAVYTQPPKPIGRGKKIQKQPVHEAADLLAIEVRTPLKLRKNEEELAFFKSLNADIAVVAAYGLILPQEILDAPKYGCLNIHASLLPRWRGASPIQAAILAGDEETGVCIMQMDAGLDTGDVLERGVLKLAAQETAASLHDKLALLGKELIVKVLKDYPSYTPQKQSEEGACYAGRLTREDGRITWSRSALEIARQIRAFTPWPGSFTELEGEIYRIGSVEIVPTSQECGSEEAGMIEDDALLVKCGKDSLRIMTLQRKGGVMMARDAFLRGVRGKGFAKGQKFS